MLGGQRPLHVRGQLSLQLVAAVLKPDFNLGLCELQRAGETRSLRAAQVPLHVKRRLQLKYLSLGEDGARFLLDHNFSVRGVLLELLLLLLGRVFGGVRTLRPGRGASGQRRSVFPAVLTTDSGLRVRCE